MGNDGFVVFVNGTYGVGKTSVLEHLADRFAAERLPFSLFDVDWFHRSWPPDADDPHNVLTEAENIRAVWNNYLRIGPRTPIAAGVIESHEDLERYERAFGRPLRVVHLAASSLLTERRLRGRYTESQRRALAWHLDDHRRLTARLTGAPWHELDVDTDERTPAQIASIIFDHFAPELPSDRA